MLFNTKQQHKEQHENQKEEVRPTESQRKILELIANGCNQRQASEALGIEEDTTRQQLFRFRRKVGAANVEQLIALAVQRSWIRVDDYPRHRS